MGIYVNGIEMPKEPDEMIELAIFGDGKTLKTGESWRSPVDGKCYYGPSEDMNTYSALTVPSHGRLIDADSLMKKIEHDTLLSAVFEKTMRRYLHNAPTIIPADEGEECTKSL